MTESSTRDATANSSSKRPFDVASSIDGTTKVPRESPPSDSLREILQSATPFSQTSALHSLIKEFDADQLDRVLAELDQHASPVSRDVLVHVVYRKYVETDPARALNSVRAQSSNPYITGSANGLIAAWARFNHVAATDYARSVGGWEGRELARMILVTRADLDTTHQTQLVREFGIQGFVPELLMKTAQSDPESAWHEALASSTGDHASRTAQYQIARLWAGSEPEVALQVISESLKTSPTLRRSMLSSVLSEVARTDPRSAVSLAMNEPQSSDRDVMLQRVFAEWGRISPEDAFAAAATVTSPTLRDELTRSAYEGWADHDPDAVLDVHASIPNSIRDHVLDRALAQIGRGSPESVLELAPEVFNLDRVHQSSAVRSALNSLAERDLESAVEWIEQNVHGQSKDMYINSTLMTTSYRYPQRAFDYALTVPETQVNSPEFHVILAVLHSRGDASLAKSLVPQIRSETWRTRAYSMMGTHLATADSAEAMAYGRTINETAQPEYYASVFSQFAESNLDQALSRISRVPAGAARDRALSSVVTSQSALERSEGWVRNQYERIGDEAVRSDTASVLAQIYREAGEQDLAERYQRDVEP